MKKTAFILTLILICTSFGTQANAMGIMPVEEEQSLRLFVNGERLSFNEYTQEPYMIEEEWMLPLRSVLENVGFSIVWNGETKTISISKNEMATEIALHSNEFQGFDGKLIETVQSIDIKESRAFASVEFFEKVIGLDVNSDTYEIEVSGLYDYVLDVTDNQIIPIAADVPSNYLVEQFYQYSHTVEASPISAEGNAIHVIGNNHSDDMFMGFYKRLSGFEPNTEYIFKLTFDLGTNVAGSMVGIGGSPGSSVYVKAGFMPVVPKAVEENDFITLGNVDKGNQSSSGLDMRVIGNLEKDNDDYSEAYTYKQFANYYIGTTDDEGNITLVIGTDSGFEGITDIYYDNLSVTVREANEHNLATLVEKDFELQYAVKTHNEIMISVPKVTGMINSVNEVALNQLLDKAVEGAIEGKELTYFYFSYNKKNNGLLSVVLTGGYTEAEVSKSIYQVVNIDTKTLEVINTEDMIQDENGFN